MYTANYSEFLKAYPPGTQQTLDALLSKRSPQPFKCAHTKATVLISGGKDTVVIDTANAEGDVKAFIDLHNLGEAGRQPNHLRAKDRRREELKRRFPHRFRT